MARTGNVANADEDIVLGVAAKRRASRQVDRYGAGGTVFGRVDTAATHEGVGAGSTRQCVRARAAIEQIVQAVADQPIVARGAVHILDIGEGVALGVASGCRTSAEVDGDRRRTRIVDRVGTGAAVDAVGCCATGQHVVAIAAIERIGAATARNRVGAGAAVEDVGAGVAGETVGLGRARQVEDSQQPIALGVTRCSYAGRQVSDDPEERGGVVDKVDAAAALQRVGTEPADQRVVAGTAIQQIVTAITDQAIVVPRSDRAGDAAQQIALGMTAKTGASE